MKKAQLGETARTILVIVSFIVALLVGYFLFLKATTSGNIESCKLSVQASSMGEIGGSSPLSIECNKRYVNFYKGRIDFGYNPEKMETLEIRYENKKIKKFKELNNDIFKVIEFPVFIEDV